MAVNHVTPLESLPPPSWPLKEFKRFSDHQDQYFDDRDLCYQELQNDASRLFSGKAPCVEALVRHKELAHNER
jgi:hypothetical protein